MRTVRLGFVPLADCAPLVVAQELGFFQTEGVNVELAKLQRWSQVRERLEAGELEGSHLLATLPLLSALGIDGGRCPLVVGWVLSQSGNAITLSNKLCRAGVSNAADLKVYLDGQKQDAPLHFGVVHPRSTHEIMLREWLSQGGMQVGEQVELVVSPPQEMVRRLRQGELDGFCAGEPWNQRATTSKLGGIVATGDDIMPPGMEKVLAIRRDWHEANLDIHKALLRALDSASRWLSDPVNVEAAAHLLAGKRYVNTQEPLVRDALKRQIQAGWGRILHGRRFLRFSGYGANRPDPQEFRWYLERLVLWGHAQPSDLELDLDSICLRDFYDSVVPEGSGLNRALDFESEFVEAMRCIPMAVRRKLDLVGLKLGLGQWSRLPLSERQILFMSAADTLEQRDSWGKMLLQRVDLSGGEEIKRLPLEVHPPWADLEVVPPGLLAWTRDLGMEMDIGAWRSLDELQRFALVKLSRPGHENKNFARAWAEFGLG